MYCNEPYLVTIGNHTTIADQVAFITHDNSISKVKENCYNLFGRITIGNNCFVGERAILMYGVTLADNIIVAAGSVVCNSFSEGKIIIGGNPARKIGDWDTFLDKNEAYAMSRQEIRRNMKEHPELLIRRKERL